MFATEETLVCPALIALFLQCYQFTLVVVTLFNLSLLQICNAGFLVPPSQRGHGIGTVLARSYLHYGPRLGYEASVFNLVYVNNVASVKSVLVHSYVRRPLMLHIPRRLWEGLNFEKAGRIPRAGRLRTADGQGEEYVDAWVFYRRFDPPGL